MIAGAIERLRQTSCLVLCQWDYEASRLAFIRLGNRVKPLFIDYLRRFKATIIILDFGYEIYYYIYPLRC